MIDKKFVEFCKSLENKIKGSYEAGITMDEAEKLGAEFLYAQIQVGTQLQSIDLDARMKKTGLKAIKAAVYMACAKATEKKPSDVLLQAEVDLDKTVQQAQDSFDQAEVERDALYNYLNVFKEAHIYFRSIAKGRFE